VVVPGCRTDMNTRMNTSSVCRYRDLIRSHRTLEGAGQALAQAADALGWDLAGFQIEIRGSAPPRTPSGDYIHHVMGWPAQYLHGWAQLGMGERCPVAQHCLDTMESFFWTCSSSDGIWRGVSLTAGQREVLDYYGELVSGGMAVCVRRGQGKAGYISWCKREFRSLRERYERTFSSAFLLSHAFIYHVEQLGMERGGDANAPELSSRELECLLWAARGKTEEDISLILRRSPATVHFHLRNAVIKLGACNRTHAVAIACTRGLIHFDGKNYLNR